MRVLTVFVCVFCFSSRIPMLRFPVSIPRSRQKLSLAPLCQRRTLLCSNFSEAVCFPHSSPASASHRFPPVLLVNCVTALSVGHHLYVTSAVGRARDRGTHDGAAGNDGASLIGAVPGSVPILTTIQPAPSLRCHVGCVLLLGLRVTTSGVGGWATWAAGCCGVMSAHEVACGAGPCWRAALLGCSSLF